MLIILVDAKYNFIREKKFFKNVLDMFCQMSNPTMEIVTKPSFEFQPRVAENMLTQKDPLGKLQKTIDLWLQLFSDILDDEQLTKKMQNILKGTLGTEGSPKESIVANILEMDTTRIQRTKWRYGI